MRSRLPDYTVRTAVALMSVVFVACRSDSVVDPEHQHHTNPTVAASISGAIKADVARLRNVVAPLHQLSVAQEAGFNLALSQCVASPAGGMGFHWGNMSRIDATAKWD